MYSKDQEKRVSKGVFNVCDWTKNILEELRDSDWLKNRTILIRYEDLAINPRKTAKVSSTEFFNQKYFALEICEHLSFFN